MLFGDPSSLPVASEKTKKVEGHGESARSRTGPVLWRFGTSREIDSNRNLLVGAEVDTNGILRWRVSGITVSAVVVPTIAFLTRTVLAAIDGANPTDAACTGWGEIAISVP